jgi:hypothetical protein
MIILRDYLLVTTGRLEMPLESLPGNLDFVKSSKFKWVLFHIVGLTIRISLLGCCGDSFI